MMKNTTRSEAAHITKRLLRSLPTTRFEMNTLTRLAGIETTRALPTAAVECKRRPRLLINPDFVEAHCKRDEHLFLLVMHELWHVLLGHTRMYPRMTDAQNIAFDAIINAGLMREFNAPEYMGFFDQLNPADQFPGCLLRPPVGWPHNPVYPEEIGPPGTAQIIMRLYPAQNSRNTRMPLYEEVLNLLLRAGIFPMPLLLGNHSDEPINDPYMKEMMKQVTQEWPEIKMLEGRGYGGYVGRRTFHINPASEDARRVFSRTLQRTLLPRQGRQHSKARMSVKSEGGNGVLPNAHDRLSPAKRALGAPGTIWAQPGTTKARVPEHPSRSFVYLDVSGSMNFVLSNLLHLLVPYVAKGHAEAYQFSTQVHGLPFNQLNKGMLTTTGGTDINCVLEHALKVEPYVQRVLIVTDGQVGPPLPHLASAVQDRAMRLHVVLPHGCRLDKGVELISTTVVELPPIH
ncbi:MAG: hypothetical protein OHK0046_40150 [Anaerolineae bacterium]